MTKPIRLPRISPRINPRIQSLLPEKVQLELSKNQLPDHVVEARQECAYQFLEDVFLPEIALNGQFDAEWLIRQAEIFKNRFRSLHPDDFKDFALISSIEAKLELLQMSKSVDGSTYALIQNGYELLRLLMNQHGNTLRQI